jgi:hypothetical protein
MTAPDTPRFNPPRFDPAEALAPLCAFQRRTVDYVFARLFEDAAPTRQFLVADEVGLGKTMVARGVIAKTVERLWDRVDRIDVLYVCSNQAIARQNLSRLNVLPQSAQALPTRITLLPLQMQGAKGLAANKVNFISLTPGTTFELRSSTGIAKERALILRILADGEPAPEDLSELLRVTSGPEGWTTSRADADLPPLDEALAATFRARLAADAALSEEIAALRPAFAGGADTADKPSCDRRNALVGGLRKLLAEVCVDALEPDLVILDEFQRFHSLLHGDSDAALLAQQIFGYVDPAGNAARTLLLSATPYRMLTLTGDEEADGSHHADFLSTLRFLFGADRGEAEAREVDADMQRLRAAMLRLPGGYDAALSAKQAVETRLRRVIARTERVDFTAQRDAMKDDVEIRTTVEPQDLEEAMALCAVARAAGAPQPIEYWKSSPYVLNFMRRDFALKMRFTEQDDAPSAALFEAVKRAAKLHLTRASVKSYQPLRPANGRMRALMADMEAQGLTTRLWLPPSAPSFGEAQTATKALVFSDWSMTPDAIAAVLSHESERRMGAGEDGAGYFARRARPLRFARAEGRLTGLRALLLVCPFPSLAQAADPLRIVAEAGRRLTEAELRAEVASRIRPLLAPILAATAPSEVETWDWAAPTAMDAAAGLSTVDWLRAGGAAQPEEADDDGEDNAFAEHLTALANAVEGRALTGAPEPEAALALFTDLALGAPATCALRALARVAPELAWTDPALLSAAAAVARGFRTLYNQHDAGSLLKLGHDGAFWRAALAYGAAHDLPAVLDEYIHVLIGAEGLSRFAPAELVEKLGELIEAALSLRPAQIEIDLIRARAGKLTFDKPFRMRGRFAMRLAGGGGEDGGQSRVEAVRAAFNSPFHPFVLASTSVGQEGLDFHHYCHRIWHWNLPGNPVDLEQREGRVHRFAGHAIRKNLAAAHGDLLLGAEDAGVAPWPRLFAAAEAAAPPGADLSPWWILEGDARIESVVPLPPFSREAGRLGWLRRSVAVYRLAFGQPRQDDLLAWLHDLDPDSLTPEQLSALQINLRPIAGAPAPKENA